MTIDSGARKRASKARKVANTASIVSLKSQTYDWQSDLTSIGWDKTTFPLPNPTLVSLGQGRMRCTNIDVVQMFIAKYSDPATWQTYWVRTDGTGTFASPPTTPGDTPSGAFGSVSDAQLTANATGIRARIKIRGGMTYSRNRGFVGPSGNVFPTVPTAYVAYSGRVNIGPYDLPTWAADTTYSWISVATRSNTTRVFDLLNRTDTGMYVELVPVPSQAACSRTPNSWAQVSTLLYVNRGDGAVCSSTNTRVFIKDIPNFSHTQTQGAQQYFAFYGETDADGFDFEGGSTGAIRHAYNTTPPASKILSVAKNCTFRYAGGYGQEFDGISIDGIHGLWAFQGCDASCASKDNWNFHNTALVGCQTAILTINCTGYRAGLVTNISNNAWTGHDDIRCADICSDFGIAKGSTVHYIGTSKAILIGSRVWGSLGDIMNGGGSTPAEIRTGDTASILLRYVTVTPSSPSQTTLRADDTGTILYRDCLLGGTLMNTLGTGIIAQG